jgi:hypothetical protein
MQTNSIIAAIAYTPQEPLLAMFDPGERDCFTSRNGLHDPLRRSCVLGEALATASAAEIGVLLRYEPRSAIPGRRAQRFDSRGINARPAVTIARAPRAIRPRTLLQRYRRVVTPTVLCRADVFDHRSHPRYLPLDEEVVDGPGFFQTSNMRTSICGAPKTAMRNHLTRG